ncbi:MAG: hypothetical protein HY075_09415 [Deltaproteobacteria bacterium]|nr:hypothetical protein [Deltaproteobacteria bacterium]
MDKMMFPEVGVTKRHLLLYYEKVAPKLLPQLKNRPMTLERLPNGVGGPHFWQKNTPDYFPSWIPRAVLPTADGKPVRYALVNELDALLYLVDQGTVTFHPYLSTIDRLDRPDFVLFDLDPGTRGFRSAVEVALVLRAVLAERELEATVKTSGMSGLHVLVPWKGEGGYDEAREWAMHVARDAVVTTGKLATTERLKSRRHGRLYVDVVQNARGHHVVAPYSVRATPWATVSTPLDWSEVDARLDPRDFTVRSALGTRAHAGGRRAA